MLPPLRALPLGAFLALGLTACFFPDYTFTAGAGGATTSSTVVSSSMSSGTGGTGPTEDCFNGSDDDADGLADCADPDCAPATECVGPIPVGWGTFGYVVLGEADPTTPPTCPSYASSVKYVGNKTLLGGAFSCSQCDCDPPMAQSCDLSTDLNSGKPGIQPFQIRNKALCDPSATTLSEISVPNTWDLTCTDGAPVIDSVPGGQLCVGVACNQSIFAALPTVSGGSCMPTGGAPILAAPTWDFAATACGNIAQMAGCSGQDRCLPKPASPFAGRVCIGKAGDQTCPTGAFSKKHLYDGSFTDTRACEMCQCNGPVGGTCKMQIELHSDDPCVALPIATFQAGTCAPLVGNPRIGGRVATVTEAPNGGSCTPTQVDPAKMGGVAAGDPTTFCCLP